MLRRKWTGLCRLMALALLASCCFGGGAAADGAYSLSITVGNSDIAAQRAGIVLAVYKIGDMDADSPSGWRVYDLYDGIDIVGAETSREIDAASEAVRQVIAEKHVQELLRGATDQSGHVSFSGLDAGIYYGEMVSGPQGLLVQTFLVNVPTWEDGQALHVVEMEPKYILLTPAPTDQPTDKPTDHPTDKPTDQPTDKPTDQPTDKPTDEPTNGPTDAPTAAPTRKPTDAPTEKPTEAPTEEPTARPPAPTEQPTYTVTVRYWVGDEAAFPTRAYRHHSGERYSIVSPAMPGCNVDYDVITGTMGNEDVTFDVHYTPISYQLTIRYIYADGTAAAPSYQATMLAGGEYDVQSPQISGFVPTTRRVSGRMPGRDAVFTVIYTPEGNTSTVDISIEDYETPMGLDHINMHTGVCFE